VQATVDPRPRNAEKAKCSAAVTTRGNGSGFARGRWRFQLECAGELDAQMHLIQGDFGAATEEAKVADFHKSAGQDMGEKAPHKFQRIQNHDAASLVFSCRLFAFSSSQVAECVGLRDDLIRVLQPNAYEELIYKGKEISQRLPCRYRFCSDFEKD
jgi:hypothetical protein